MWRLFYPLRYFSLSNGEKRLIEVVPTIIFALMLGLPFIYWPESAFFAVDGFLDKLLSLTTALTGFCVAALVAAATFDHPDLDKPIKSGPVVLLMKNPEGKRVPEQLTRREFVCMLFGYIAFSTMMISIFAALAVGLSTNDAPILETAWLWPGQSVDIWPYLRGALILAFTLATAHTAVVTSVGIYYLMDRLYRRDRQVTTTKPKPDKAA